MVLNVAATEKNANGTEEKELRADEIFLRLFSTEKYRESLERAPIDGKTSIEVAMDDIAYFSLKLAEKILSQPDEYLKIAEDVAYERVSTLVPQHAEKIKKGKEGFKIRLRNLPSQTPMRDLSSKDLNTMVAVRGIVVRESILKPLLVEAVFECRRCGEIMVKKQSGRWLDLPSRCANPDCRSRSFKLLEEESVFIDSQEIRIQEPPDELPAGQIPRQINVLIKTRDIIGKAHPGDYVTVNGIVRAEPVGKNRTTYLMFLEANNIETRRIDEDLKLTDEDLARIKTIAKDPNVIERVIDSIAPSIHGHREIKTAIMCLLFGGVTKEFEDVKVRGEPNVLLIGDPGTAKSQMLLAAVKLAPRGIYTSGRGTSTAGLTAAVIFEERGNANLEAGALVLADKGLAAIDEFEKMRHEDRASIHEALEQKTVSIAKGGIIATLNARCSVLAAANPAFGRYDEYKTVAENFNLPSSLLSRFDLIFVLRDKPSGEDAVLARHILTLHQKKMKRPSTLIDRETLRKYIMYARNNCMPVMTEEAKDKLMDFYLRMREASGEGEGTPIAITPRQLESLIRLAEAFARAALKQEVTEKEAEMAINLMNASIQQVGVDLETGRIDIDQMIIGKPRSFSEKMKAVLGIIREIEREKGTAPYNDVKERTKEMGIEETNLDRIIKMLMQEGKIIEHRSGYFASR